MHSSHYYTANGASPDQICLLHLLFGQYQQIAKKTFCENFLVVPAIRIRRRFCPVQQVWMAARGGMAVAAGGSSVQTHPSRLTAVSASAVRVAWGCREHRL